jgi:flagellar biogenesis protein FliO
METLFGSEMPLAVRFFLAFLIVLGLIGVTAWAVRRFGGGRLGASGLRGRQPRLAVIDYASVDSRRRLILVRRDNVEHLLMIGGPTDVVVESTIVRAAAPAREVTATRAPAMAETLPRAIPLPETGSWPLQPEPAAPPPPPRPTPRIEPRSEEPTIQPAAHHAEPPPMPLGPPALPPTPSRAPRESLAALAEEITARPAPRPRPAPAARPHVAPEPRLAPAEPRLSTTPPAAPAEAETAAVDQNLAEMAHRLEAALRRPKPASEARDGRATAARAAPPAEDAVEAEEVRAAPPPLPAAPPPRPARSAETKTAPKAETKTSQGKALYDSLEQEMASLLGRPPGKT